MPSRLCEQIVYSAVEQFKSSATTNTVHEADLHDDGSIASIINMLDMLMPDEDIAVSRTGNTQIRIVFGKLA